MKPSHQIDLAYLYYLPFCSVFTSKDNFHVQVVPLFLGENQHFINGIDFKEDLNRLNELYSALLEEVQKTGLMNFAAYPPDDTTYIVTRMWDQFLPRWRDGKSQHKPQRDPDEEKRLVEELNRLSDESLPAHDERDIDKVEYAQITRMVLPKKGKWLRFSEDQIKRMYENQTKRSG